MTVFDYIVLAVIGLSVFFSLMRGMVREVLSLAGWVLAFFVAKTYTLQLAPLLPKAIPTETLQYLAAFIILFWRLCSLLLCCRSRFPKYLKLSVWGGWILC